jgi:cysteinyl-tRNA synthetase
MALRIYNTLTKNKEDFQPVTPPKVGIYLCGPTVYKPSHIGHMVGPVIFDAIKRYLVYRGYQVTLVINITDVDDKLIKESTARNMTMAALAEEMTADYRRNLAAMGVDTVDIFPKATDNIGEIIAITQELVERGFAYASEGDVYFDVTKDTEYGKLSNRDVASLQGEGGDTAERKRNAADFALWKSAKPGEPAWDSPWGKGRPGWHIECSAMSRRYLGKTFDIHGGGLDLIFPHHENEIAQSECCHGAPQAKYWMHNGLMQASSEVGKLGGRNTRAATEGDLDSQASAKISKSTGAGAFRDLLKDHRAEAIRFFLLRTHYRRPIDFGPERLAEAAANLDQFDRFFKRYARITGQSFYELPIAANEQQGNFTPGDSVMLQKVAELRGKYLEAMDDDFNTGGAVGNLFELLGVLNKFADDEKLETPSAAKPDSLAQLRQGALVVRELGAVLGMFRAEAEASSAGDDGGLVDQLMTLVIELRAAARKNKDFATADKIRNSLTAAGVTLEDRPSGTEWTKSKS